jgi:phage-related protein
MEFEILFYTDEAGNSPIEDFLIGLVTKNRVLLAQTRSGLQKLRYRAYHKEPLSKHLEAGLWEVRIKAGTDILRIIYTFGKGKIIILLHVFIKKQQKTPIDQLKIARKRLEEVKAREAN